MGVIDSIVSFISGLYTGIVSRFPPGIAAGINLILVAIIIAVVSIFIWKFYRSLSQRNLIPLNLRKYSKSSHPEASKFLASVLYLLENILLMPVLIFFWFAALSIVILIIAPEREVEQILLLTGGLVAAVRILAYYNQEIAKDLAKLFPFITLSIFILTPGAFNFETMLRQLVEIPFLLRNIFSFLIVVFVVEIALRIIYTTTEFLRTEEEEES